MKRLRNEWLVIVKWFGQKEDDVVIVQEYHPRWRKVVGIGIEELSEEKLQQV